MKKISNIFIVFLLAGVIFWLGFDYRSNKPPQEYYQVYLDDEIIGVINSKKKLEKYINNQDEYIRKKYNVSTIYAPNGLEIRKNITYKGKVDSIEEIYNKIKGKKPFTIKGYQFTIKNDTITNKIYVLDKEIFKSAIEQTIKTFVGEEKYTDYANEAQNKIETTGNIINSVYLEDNITIKEANISIEEKIYTNESDLAKFLLFGNNTVQETYKVLLGDTIETVSFNNKISVEEFMISNPDFTNKSNLLFPGQEVVIGVTDPQVRVVALEYSIKDVVSKFKVEEKYDPETIIGTEKILQVGEDGLDRISQTSKIINGVIVELTTTPIEEIKPAINQITAIGQKNVPSVGTFTNWTWPTQGGWIITTPYGYRIHPVFYNREFHAALDIAGPGSGSRIYASNNGVISGVLYNSSYGNYVIVNHNNGYYTLYAHLSRFASIKEGDVVAKGTTIGYMGTTGVSTGPHLHYEVWKGVPWGGGTRINPWEVHR